MAIDEPYPMRTSCGHCGSAVGYVEETNGQAVVRYRGCNAWMYNAPKKERGLAPQSTRTDGVSPSLRTKVAARAGYRCEFCGALPQDRTMHVGHIVSEKDLRISGLPPEFVRHHDNLSWCCDQCNLGMGERSISVHQALVFLWRRKAVTDDNELG